MRLAGRCEAGRFLAGMNIMNRINRHSGIRAFGRSGFTLIELLVAVMIIGEVDDTTNLSTGVWYFVFAAYDKPNNLLKISVNNGTVQTTSWTTGFAANAARPFQFGSLVGNSNYLDAALDEWGIWNVFLAPSRVTALYAAGSGFQPV